MEKFAEQLRNETNEEYKQWVAKHEENIKSLTANLIKQYGKAGVLCHAYCDKTNFRTCGTVTLGELNFLLKWLDDNGFKHNFSYNSHGARSIEWHL